MHASQCRHKPQHLATSCQCCITTIIKRTVHTHVKRRTCTSFVSARAIFITKRCNNRAVTAVCARSPPSRSPSRSNVSFSHNVTQRILIFSDCLLCIAGHEDSRGCGALRYGTILRRGATNTSQCEYIYWPDRVRKEIDSSLKKFKKCRSPGDEKNKYPKRIFRP